MEEKTKEYLAGYKAGFMAALTVAWACAEELLIAVPNVAKDEVRAYIKKLNN